MARASSQVKIGINVEPYIRAMREVDANMKKLALLFRRSAFPKRVLWIQIWPLKKPYWSRQQEEVRWQSPML